MLDFIYFLMWAHILTILYIMAIVGPYKWFIWTIYYWALETSLRYRLIMCRDLILINYY